MSDDNGKEVTVLEYSQENQMDPAIMGVGSNLIPFPTQGSPTRLYMASNMIPKSVYTNGASERRLITGNEYEYAQYARRIEAPSNMQVEEIFYVNSVEGSDELTDAWNSIWVVFRNEEQNMFDILELPKYNAQNTYIGFEYKYNKEVMRKLGKPDATFAKGTVFAQSPRISKSGEWCFGIDAKVAPFSSPITEEDGIGIRMGFARDSLMTMFKHERRNSWNDDEWVPLMLYGTDEDPRPFAVSGERVRDDGIVMGFRRRVRENALVSLTKKALRIPDLTYDYLLYAPKGSRVMSVEVVSERMKNRANNRNTDYIEQTHTAHLDRYERKQNDMWNSVISWYEKRLASNGGQEIPLTKALDSFIRQAYGQYTRKTTGTGRINPLSRAHKRVKLKDWNVTIILKEEVTGRVRFKMSGMNGDKGVIVMLIPDEDMPCYEDGTVSDIIVNNTPAFRRQIYSMLMEQGINFIGINVHKEVVALYNAGDWKAAYEKLVTFYRTGFLEFAEIVDSVLIDDDTQREHVEHVVNTKISVQVRSDAKLFGVNIVNALRKVYSYKPERAWITNALGERVLSKNPILITNQHFMLLDKFGTDISAQAISKSNLFGMPAKLTDTGKYGHWIADKHNRNTGETEGRTRVSQVGAMETVKQLAMAYSPELKKRMVQRIIRADDPFDINQLVRPEEYKLNRPVQMAYSMLSDSGYTLRRELPKDKISTGGGLINDNDD